MDNPMNSFPPLNQRRRPPPNFLTTIRRLVRPRQLNILGRNFKYYNKLSLTQKVRRSFGITNREAFQVANIALGRNRQRQMVYLLQNGELIRQQITRPIVENTFGSIQVAGLERSILRSAVGRPRTRGGIRIQAGGVDMDIPIRMSVEVDFTIEYSAEPVEKTDRFIMTIAPSQLTEEFMREHILTTTWGESDNVNSDTLQVVNITFSPFNQPNVNLTLTGSVVRRCSPINIMGVFNEKISMNDSYECCRDYVKHLWSKKTKSRVEYYYANEIDKCRTTDDFYKLCKKKDIKMLVYDIDGNVLKKYYKEGRNKNALKSLVYIQYNNHIYPVKNKYITDATNYLRKFKSAPKFRYLPYNLVHKKFMELWNSNVLPTKIKIQHNKVVSFDYEDTHYSNNGEYKRCRAILKKFGLEDKAYYGLRLSGMSNIFDKAYFGLSECVSFFPNAKKYVKGGFLHINSKYEYNLDNTIAVDCNKAYTDKLRKLPYLITLDIRKSIMNKDPKQEIIEHYLYVVEVDKSTIILPNNNIYTGLMLQIARKEKINFTIKYSYSTIKTQTNPYRTFITELYKKANPNDAKMIVNCMVGKFERCIEITKSSRISKVCDKEEALRTEGFIGKLQDCVIDKFGSITQHTNKPLGIMYGDDDKDIEQLCNDTKKWEEKQVHFIREEYGRSKFNLYNKKPIAIQVKDQTRIDLYCLMKSLYLRDSEIYYIKTDCVAFKKGIMTDYVLEDFVGKGIGKWKYEKLKDMTNKFYIPRNLNTIKFECSNDKNTLYDCNAGAGKTYKVINEIIPKLIKDGEDYVVLAPQHSALREYRLNNINCEVIQHYTYRDNALTSETFPTEKNIIIDEWGMLGSKELMYIFKLHLLGKTIIALGDYDQLLPVSVSIKSNMVKDKEYTEYMKQAFNGELWIKLLFNNTIRIKKNYRNNFTPEYYDSLKNGSKDYIQEQMKKHRTHWKEADTIITYRHKFRHKYNALKCEYLDIPFRSVAPDEEVSKGKINPHIYTLTLIDPTNIKVGTKLICNTNKFKCIGLYNKYIVEVKEVNDKGVILLDDAKNEISLPLTKLISYSEDKNKMSFSFAYCRTLYSIQGESIEGGIYFPDDDLYWLDNRACYTLISRKKEEKIQYLTPLPQKRRE